MRDMEMLSSTYMLHEKNNHIALRDGMVKRLEVLIKTSEIEIVPKNLLLPDKK